MSFIAAAAPFIRAAAPILAPIAKSLAKRGANFLLDRFGGDASDFLAPFAARAIRWIGHDTLRD